MSHPACFEGALKVSNLYIIFFLFPFLHVILTFLNFNYFFLSFNHYSAVYLQRLWSIHIRTNCVLPAAGASVSLVTGVLLFLSLTPVMYLLGNPQKRTIIELPLGPFIHKNQLHPFIFFPIYYVGGDNVVFKFFSICLVGYFCNGHIKKHRTIACSSFTVISICLSSCIECMLDLWLKDQFSVELHMFICKVTYSTLLSFLTLFYNYTTRIFHHNGT